MKKVEIKGTKTSCLYRMKFINSLSQTKNHLPSNKSDKLWVEKVSDPSKLKQINACG